MKLKDLCSRWMVVCLIILCFLFQCNEAGRNLTLHMNPNCEEYSVCSDIKDDLVYVKAVGSSDTLHYLWSMQGVPSMLVVLTNVTASLNINWTNLLSSNTDDSVTFSEEPIYSFGMLISKIWLYNDTGNDATLGKYHVRECDFSEVQWKTSNSTYNDECSAVFSSVPNNSSGLLSEGSFILKLVSYGTDGRSDKFPHYLFNSDIFQIQIILDKLLVTNETSRYALEIMIKYAASNGSEHIKKKEYTTLDDEFTPGVFTVVELTTPLVCDSKKCNGFLFWKPIAYTDAESTVAHSTDVKLYRITNKSLPFSIIEAFFGNCQSVSTAAWNISLGIADDGFYNKTQYTSWTLTVGLGAPPEDVPSLLIMLTIGIGFGLPFLCMVVGGGYMGFRRFLKKEDDLLLSRDSM